MLRGNAFDNRKVQVDYSAYFSPERKSGRFQAGRVAGERIDVYLPNHRLEIGSSYQRFLQDTRVNSFGFHLWWMPPRSAIQIRSEYAHRSECHDSVRHPQQPHRGLSAVDGHEGGCVLLDASQ